MSKTFFISSWEDWVSVCEENNVDPHAYADFSRSTGGENIDYFEFVGEYPKEEED